MFWNWLMRVSVLLFLRQSLAVVALDLANLDATMQVTQRDKLASRCRAQRWGYNDAFCGHCRCADYDSRKCRRPATMLAATLCRQPTLLILRAPEFEEFAP